METQSVHEEKQQSRNSNCANDEVPCGSRGKREDGSGESVSANVELNTMPDNRRDRNHISNDGSIEEKSLMFSNISETNAHQREVASSHGSGSASPRWLQSAPFKKIRHPAETSLLWTVLVTFTYLITAFIICCPVIVLIVVALPIGLIVRCILATCCCCSPGESCVCRCTSLLSPADSFWLHESNFNKSIIHGLVILERGLSFAQIRELLQARLVSVRDCRGKKLYPRFTRKVVRLKCGYAWVDDKAFSLDNHVFAIPEHVVRTRTDLEKYLGELASRRELTLDRPLWEIFIAFNCGDMNDTAVIIRAHEALADGICLCRTLCHALADQHAIDFAKSRSGSGAVMFNSVRSLLVGPLYILTQFSCFYNCCDYFNRKPLMGKKKLVWSDPISMPQLERIKCVSRSTFNDVLLSIVTGCIRNYLQSKGIQHPPNLYAIIPFDFHSDDPNSLAMGTESCLAPLRLPTNVEGLIPRLWKVKRIMEELKNSADVVSIYGLMHLLTYTVPESVLHAVMSLIFKKTSVIVSNMAGPSVGISFATKPIKSIIAFVPPKEEISISISMLSYDRELRIGIVTDEALIPDPEVLLKEFHFQVNQLSELLANRRVPGESRHRDDYDFDDVDEGPEPSAEELQDQLHHVQDELQELKLRMESGDSGQDLKDAQESLLSRVEELKEEFAELLAELRRRKNSDIRLEDEDIDLELLRRYHRKRSLSNSSRKSSISTARPLTAPDSSRRGSSVRQQSESSPGPVRKDPASISSMASSSDQAKPGMSSITVPSRSCYDMEAEYDMSQRTYHSRMSSASSVSDTQDGRGDGAERYSPPVEKTSRS